MARFWSDELVRETLMMALAVIMSDEVLNGCPQRLLAEEDQAIQAVGVPIGGSRWQLDGLHPSIGNHVPELLGEQRVTVVNQVPFPNQDSIF